VLLGLLCFEGRRVYVRHSARHLVNLISFGFKSPKGFVGHRHRSPAPSAHPVLACSLVSKTHPTQSSQHQTQSSCYCKYRK